MNHLKESAITKKKQKENISSDKAIILNFFKENPHRSFTTKEIEEKTFATKNNVHKRISELIREGLIMSGTKKKVGKTKVNCWILSSPYHVEQLKRRQLETDYKNWLKQGERFKDLIDESKGL